MKILCLFGENQYGQKSRGKSLEATSFIPALEMLGHTVELFDIWDRSQYTGLDDLNRKLLAHAEKFKPDMVVFVPMTVEVWTETLDILRRYLNIRVMMWCTDDTWKLRETSLFFASHVDLIATTYDSAVNEYRRLGFNHVVKTQWAADTHRLSEPIPAARCSHRVTFVGQASPSRKKFIHELSTRGIDVECFGHDWPEGSLTADQVYQIMRDSVITLNFADSYKGGLQLKARNFEAPGAGGFLLTEYAQGIDVYFIPDQEIVCFENVHECAEKIKFYLAEPLQRDQIARNGMQRVQMEHTYKERYKNLLESLAVIPARAVQKTSLDFHSEFEHVASKHTRPWWLRGLRMLLVSFCHIMFSKKSSRAARRLIFEISWRISGEKTYSSSGLPGRMFPESLH